MPTQPRSYLLSESRRYRLSFMNQKIHNRMTIQIFSFIIFTNYFNNILQLQSMFLMPKAQSKPTTTLLKLIFLQLVLAFAHSVLASLPQLYIDHLQFWTRPCTAKSYSSTGYTTSFPFRTSLPTIYEIGLSHERTRRNTPGSFLSFSSKISKSSTGISITLNPINIGAELCYMAYSLMIITQPTNYIQIVNADLTFTVLNIKTRSNNYEYFTLSSTKFTFPVNYLAVAPFLTHLVTNDGGMISQHYEVYASPITNTFNIQIRIGSSTSWGNSFTTGRVGVLLVDLSGYDSRIATYSNAVWIYSWQGYTFPNDFGVPNSLFGNAINGNNCVMGLNIFWVFPPNGNIQLSFNFASSKVSSPNYGSQCTYVIQVNCFALCTAPNLIVNHANSYSCVTCASTLDMPNSVYYNSTSASCLPCSTNLLDCAFCSSSTVCLKCKSKTMIVALNSSGCYQCNVYIPNCAVCLSSASCQTCVTNYLLASNTASCQHCSVPIPNCAACTNSSICITCAANYYLTSTNTQCLDCPSFISFCAVCVNSSYCSSCISNYFVDSTHKVCHVCWTWISNCAVCANTSICTTCQSNYFVNSVGQCAICSTFVTNCSVCASVSTCSICASGYYLDPGTLKCSPCSVMSNCFTCNNSSICITCIPGFFINNSYCFSCASLIPHCSSCTTNTSCVACEINYFVAANLTTCLLCSNFMPGCVNCLNQSYCYSCIANYFVTPNQSACLICNYFITDCDVCYNHTTCYSCFTNTSLTISQTRCIDCVGYILDCKVCYNQTMCFACVQNFFPTPDSSQCQPCANLIYNCSVCYNHSYCVLCSSDIFFLSSDNSHCLSCSAYLQNCVTCISQYVCTQCINSSWIVLKQDSCQMCRDIIPSCKYCNTPTNCTQCLDGYYPSSDQQYCFACGSFMPGCRNCAGPYSCLQCSIGWPVEGGCTTTAGCIALLYSTTTCLKCNSNMFVYSEAKRQCVCRTGKLVGIYCIDSQGCLTAIPVGNSFECISCNVSRKFYYNNATKQCECLMGYTLQNSFCVDKCGDGRVITNQCDDGNLVDGDGCSHLCTVEVLFNCSGGTINSPTSCTYIGMNLQIDLVDTQKTSGQNQAVFTFDVKPKMPLFSKMSLMNYFIFSCNCSSSVQRWTYENGQIKLYLNYDTGIEGTNGHISFSFDQHFIKHRSIDFSFTIQSNGTLLYFYNELGKQKITRYSFLGFSFLLILMTVVGSFLREMAGVELIQVLQTIYYLHYSVGQYTQTISSMQYLSLVALNNLFMQEEGQNYAGFQKYQKIKFSSFYAEMSLIGITSFLVLSLLTKFIWSRVYQYMKMRNYKMKKPIKDQQREQNEPKIVDHFHSAISFPYTLALLLPTYFVINTYLIRNHTDFVYLFPTFRSILIFTSICIIFINLSKEYLNRAFQSQDQRAVIGFKAKQFYGCCYLIYQIYELIALWVWMVKGWTLCLYVMIGGTVTMIVWQIKKKPYTLTLSNTSIFLNQFLLFLYQLYLFLKIYSFLQSNEKTDTMVNLTFVAIMLLCSVLTTMRVFRATYNSCRNSSETNKQSVEMKVKKEQQNLFAKISCMKESMLDRRSLKKEGSAKQGRYLQPKQEQKVDEQLNKLVKRMKKQFYENRRRQNLRNKTQVI